MSSCLITMAENNGCSVKHGFHTSKTVGFMLGLQRIYISLTLSIVNALIFLAPISAFDQVLAEVKAASILSRLENAKSSLRIRESIALKIRFCYGGL